MLVGQAMGSSILTSFYKLLVHFGFQGSPAKNPVVPRRNAKINTLSALSQQCSLFHHALPLQVAQTRCPRANIFRNRGSRDWKGQWLRTTALRACSTVCLSCLFRRIIFRLEPFRKTRMRPRISTRSSLATKDRKHRDKYAGERETYLQRLSETDASGARSAS